MMLKFNSKILAFNVLVKSSVLIVCLFFCSTISKGQKFNQVKFELFSAYRNKIELSYDRNILQRYGVEAMLRMGYENIPFATGLKNPDYFHFPSRSVGGSITLKRYFEPEKNFRRGYILLVGEVEQLRWVHPKYEEWYLIRRGKLPDYSDREYISLGIGTGFKHIVNNWLVVEPSIWLGYNFWHKWSRNIFGLQVGFAMRFGIAF